jgi:prepilin-type N-terminal cleavage/methylation domain-containing protein
MKILIVSGRKGLSLVEMIIVLTIFSLFLIFMYATFDVGMKSWQLGAVRSELQQTAEVAMKRITKELAYTTITSLKIDNSAKNIVFETPIDLSSGEFKYDDNIGVSLWQGYVLYYTSSTSKGILLYRKYMSRTSIGRTVSSFPLIFPSSTTLYSSGGNVIARNLIAINFLKDGPIITVTIKYQKNIRSNAPVVIAGGGTTKTGTENFEIKSSVEPKN